MANQGTTTSPAVKPAPATPSAKAAKPGKPSALLDTRVGYRGDILEHFGDRLPTPLIFVNQKPTLFGNVGNSPFRLIFGIILGGINYWINGNWTENPWIGVEYTNPFGGMTPARSAPMPGTAGGASR